MIGRGEEAWNEVRTEGQKLWKALPSRAAGIVSFGYCCPAMEGEEGVVDLLT